MLKKILKRMLILSIVGVTTLSLSGCGESELAINFTNNDLPESIRKRFEANIAIIDSLENANFISASTAQDYEDNIREILNDFESNRITIDEDGINGHKEMLKAISQLRCYSWDGLSPMSYYIDTVEDDEGNEFSVAYCRDEEAYNSVSLGSDYKDFGNEMTNNFIISNLFTFTSPGINGNVPDATSMIRDDIQPQLYHLGYTNSSGVDRYIGDEYLNYYVDDSGNSWAGHRYASGNHLTLRDISSDGKEVQPMELVSTDLCTEINNRMNFDVYVLKDDIFTQDGNATLDTLISVTNEYLATDSTGQLRHDVTSINNQLSNYFEPLLDDSGNRVKMLDLALGGEDVESFGLIKESKDVDFDSYNTDQKPGYDLVICQNEIDEPIMSIKFIEFDYEAYLNLCELVGLNDGKYYFIQDDGDSASAGRVYILEYPVYRVNSLTGSSDSTEVTVSFQESGLGVNFFTGDIIKYDVLSYNSSSDTYTYSKNGTVISELVDQYLTIAGSDLSNGISSFVVNGSVPISYNIDINGNQKTITGYSGRIILRDYLEATYAPEFNDDNLVVFGRKIRLDFSNFNDDGQAVWNTNTPVAYYIDKDGNKISNGSVLYTSDFCGATALNNSENTRVYRLPALNEPTGLVEGTDLEGEMKTINDVPTVVTVNIKPTTMFPGKIIGVSDYDNDSASKQRFWLIATNKGIFDSGLYASWINSTSSTASLDWWNKYLGDNTFQYRVDHANVNNYLLENFKYELGQSGIVLLDLDTVAFIQEEMDEEAETERTELIRTIFIVLGWFLIFYSLFLMLAWIIDTNSDIGIDLLTKLTMGNWIAIKYPEDIPGGDLSNTKYISASGITLSCIIIIAVGILIINVDIIKLVMLLINTFGSIAGEIEKMLKGFR